MHLLTESRNNGTMVKCRLEPEIGDLNCGHMTVLVQGSITLNRRVGHHGPLSAELSTDSVQGKCFSMYSYIGLQPESVDSMLRNKSQRLNKGQKAFFKNSSRTLNLNHLLEWRVAVDLVSTRLRRRRQMLTVPRASVVIISEFQSISPLYLSRRQTSPRTRYQMQSWRVWRTLFSGVDSWECRS